MPSTVAPLGARKTRSDLATLSFRFRRVGLPVARSSWRARTGWSWSVTSGVFPPLKDSAVVTAPDPTAHVRTVLRGLSGKTIGGVTYAAAMPAFADQLTDDEVAAVLSHKRTSWGNQAPPVKPENVLARRH